MLMVSNARWNSRSGFENSCAFNSASRFDSSNLISERDRLMLDWLPEILPSASIDSKAWGPAAAGKSRPSCENRCRGLNGEILKVRLYESAEARFSIEPEVFKASVLKRSISTSMMILLCNGSGVIGPILPVSSTGLPSRCARRVMKIGLSRDTSWRVRLISESSRVVLWS